MRRGPGSASVVGSVLRAALCAAAGLAVLASSAGPARAARVLTVTDFTDDAKSPAPGSLRDVIENQAQAGDVVRFGSPGTIELASGLLVRSTLAGLTIEGPAELRVSRPKNGRIRVQDLRVLAHGVTIRGMSFTNTWVEVNNGGFGRPRIAGLRVEDCRFQQAAVLSVSGVDDAEILRDTFEPHDPYQRAHPAMTLLRTRRAHVAGCTVEVAHDDTLALAEEDGEDLLVEDCTFRNGIVAGAVSGVFRRISAPGQRMFVARPVIAVPAHVSIADCALGALFVARVDVDVTRNTIDASTVADSLPRSFMRKYRKSQQQNALTVLTTVITGSESRAPVVVTENTVTGGQTAGISVAESFDVDSIEVSGNTVERSGRWGIAVRSRGTFLVDGNVVRDTGTSPGAEGIRVLADEDGLRLTGNRVLGSAGSGIVVYTGAGQVEIEGGEVRDCARTGIQFAKKRGFLATDVTVEDNGGSGFVADPGATGTIRGGAVRRNGGAGVTLGPNTRVAIDGVAFGGNAGLGIDLAPQGVTPNAKPKRANADMDWPDTLEFDAATGKVTGVTLPIATVQAYAVEEGARAGNPAHGEGAAYLGSVTAGSDGRFTWPASGRAPCPPSGKITFTATATVAGAGGGPRTSEFSPDVDCGAGGATDLVSVTPAGAAGNAASETHGVSAEPNRILSADGRFVVFTSAASDLVPGDTNRRDDVFVRDRQSGVTVRASLTSAGGEIVPLDPDFPIGASVNGAISADGRYVVFQSDGAGIVPGDGGNNTERHVYVRDLVGGTTVYVSDPTEHLTPLPSGRTRHLAGFDPSISADGNFVAFVSQDSDWDVRDVNHDLDVFVWNRTSGAVEMASLTTAGAPSAELFYPAASTPRLSADGRHVAFATAYTLTPGDTIDGLKVFVRDRVAGTTTLVSRTGAGAPAGGDSPSISDDGRRIVFVSYADLVPEDANGKRDVYLRDLDAGTTVLVSRDPQQALFAGDCNAPWIAGGGRYVAFSGPGGHVFGSGFTAIFDDVWIRDLTLDTTTEGSVGADGDADGPSRLPSLSPDGRFLAFTSSATNLAPGDANGARDVFLHDRSDE